VVFSKLDRLLLLRAETRNGKTAPFESNRVDHPLVCPLRELRAKSTAETIKIISDFNWHLHDTRASPDGRYFVLEGLSGPEGNTRAVNAYDASGNRLWTHASRKTRDAGAFIRFDTTGEILLLDESLNLKDCRGLLLTTPSKSLLSVLEYSPYCVGPGARRWVLGPEAGGSPPGVSLFERGRDGPLVKILIADSTVSVYAEFSPDGAELVWGNPDGSVTLCDLPEIRRRLAGLGMGW
jgi:hypothetical protein